MDHELTLALATIIACLLLAVFHWFPYVRRLSRVQAYAIGCTAIWVGFTIWRGIEGDWLTPAGLAVIIVFSGVTVITGYRIDHWTRRIRQAERAEQSDDELQE